MRGRYYFIRLIFFFVVQLKFNFWADTACSVPVREAAERVIKRKAMRKVNHDLHCTLSFATFIYLKTANSQIACLRALLLARENEWTVAHAFFSSSHS